MCLTLRAGWAKVVWDGTDWVVSLRRRHHDVIGLRDGRVTRITRIASLRANEEVPRPG